MRLHYAVVKTAGGDGVAIRHPGAPTLRRVDVGGGGFPAARPAHCCCNPLGKKFGMDHQRRGAAELLGGGFEIGNRGS
jgi:hypothetical protein